MNWKKLTALALAGTMTLALAACAPSGGDAGKDSYTVGICQIAPHDALDAATKGFKDRLTEVLGDKVTFKDGNAGGDPNNCVTIIDGFMTDKVDLILANATPVLVSAASATDTVPILGTAVTNYGVALSLPTTEDKVLGGNISGTSDLAPLDQQAQVVKELFPDAKNIGLLYCSAEPNSIFQVETITKYLTDLGYTCANYAFTDVNDLASVTQAACDKSDVIYIPTDNTAAANTEAIANVVIPAGVPVIAGEAGIAKGCGVATLSIDYYELGKITADMAVKVLKGEAKVGELPIAYDTTVTKMYNADNCDALGITPPEGYEPIK